MFGDQIIANVVVCRVTGNSYSPWRPIEEEEVPAWVRDAVGDAIAEEDVECGEVWHAGTCWTWRKGDAKP